jgi:hypothetical protein
VICHWTRNELSYKSFVAIGERFRSQPRFYLQTRISNSHHLVHFPAAYGHIHRRDISSLCILKISCARARLFRALAACQPAPPGARKISAPKNPTISAQRPLLRIPGINSVFPLCRYSSLRFRLQRPVFLGR